MAMMSFQSWGRCCITLGEDQRCRDRQINNQIYSNGEAETESRQEAPPPVAKRYREHHPCHGAPLGRPLASLDVSGAVLAVRIQTQFILHDLRRDQGAELEGRAQQKEREAHRDVNIANDRVWNDRHGLAPDLGGLSFPSGTVLLCSIVMTGGQAWAWRLLALSCACSLAPSPLQLGRPARRGRRRCSMMQNTD
jgi:hypothetical protein